MNLKRFIVGRGGDKDIFPIPEILFLIAVWFLLTLGGCSSGPRPAFHGKIYDAGSWPGVIPPAPGVFEPSKIYGVRRNQTNEKIACTEPAFDHLVCMFRDDHVQFLNMLQACKKW